MMIKDFGFNGTNATRRLENSNSLFTIVRKDIPTIKYIYSFQCINCDILVQ